MWVFHFLIKVGEIMEGSALETLGTSVTFLLENFTNMAGELLTTPLFLIGIGFFVIGGSIGLVHRILH